MEWYVTNSSDTNLGAVQSHLGTVRMSYMYGICGVSHFCGNTACQKNFFQIVSKKQQQKKRSGFESQKSRFGFDPKNPPRVWILWIHDPFLDLPPKKEKSSFGLGNPDLDFPKKTHPQTPYFLPALTPALTFNFT